MVYVIPSENLSPFQRWILLQFHQQPKVAITSGDLITSCCITAMDATFDKDSGRRDIKELENMDLITQDGHFNESAEHLFTIKYISTIDGAIYAKKMMKPILDAMNKDQFEDALRKLDDPQSLRYLEAMFRNKTQSQQDRLKDLAHFGLNNITGFGKILEAVHQMAAIFK